MYTEVCYFYTIATGKDNFTKTILTLKCSFNAVKCQNKLVPVIASMITVIRTHSLSFSLCVSVYKCISVYIYTYRHTVYKDTRTSHAH